MANTKTTSDLKSFHYLESGEVSYSPFETKKSVSQMDKGFYKLKWLDYPQNRVEVSQVVDTETIKIHSFPDRDKIESLFEGFLNPEVKNKHNLAGFNRKIGILFHGKEGGGKSSIIKYYANKFFAENDALVFYINDIMRLNELWDFVVKIRQVQDTLIVVIIDEIDEFLEIKGNEGRLKSITDGNLSIDNCIFFASTNYIDKIPDALKNRASRFKYSINIEGIQDIEAIYNIIHPLLKDVKSEIQLKELAKELEGNTIDIIKQTCIDRWMDIKSYTKKSKKIGFVLNGN